MRAGRKPQSELDGPPIPPAALYLWRWFCELERTRQLGEHGVQAMTYTEIAAWARLTERTPYPHEVDALLALDVAVRLAMQDGDDAGR